MNKFSFTLLVFAIFFVSCNSENQDTLFKSLTAEESGISFENKVENLPEMNIFNYRNFYNGGGVAIGDINNDGFSDVFLVANQGENRLFLNKGNKNGTSFSFEDITKKASVGGSHAFSTGAVMADVNGDGWLDIYVCNSGEMTGDNRANELYINNKDQTFTEKAAEYGLDDRGYSTHASFFDYDRDGDLDMFLLENSSYPANKLGYQNIRDTRDVLAGQKLFRNSQINGVPHFEDVSEEAGIYGSLIGFGLGITIGDINNDQWADIYISNDFYERDYLYINQKNGQFRESSKESMGHISLSSMGADIADINNDGNLDIFSTDMLPFDDFRAKTTMTYEDYNLEQLKLQNDFFYQYSRNMLQLNNGDGTFSEIGALAGVHATDWSWGALIFDMDNDGQKDIFVANGIYKNVTNQDFVQFLNEDVEQIRNHQKVANKKEMIDKMETIPIPNYAFKNNGNLNFENKANDWGLSLAGFSSGAAYGDLDNDGDLDLIINNTNQPVSVLLNQSVEKYKTAFLRVKLVGKDQNKFGIGARVKLYQNGSEQVLEQMPNRGFESSSDYTMVFGLGKMTKIDSLSIVWSDGQKQILPNPKINTTITFDYLKANLQENTNQKPVSVKPFADITTQTGIDFIHQENQFVDYDRDPLLKQMYSRLGPALAKADVNNDGLDDIFVGAAAGQLKKLYIQNQNGTFKENSTAGLNFDANAEVVSGLFFDADNDKDQDLLMVTGSNDFFPQDLYSADYLYLNDGKGNFTKDIRFPKELSSGACAAATDFDSDGDLDVFVGGRLVATQYGMSPESQFYVNQGNGNFVVSKNIFSNSDLGMVTDATWSDLDNDHFPELILTRDWGSIVVLKNEKGKKLIFSEIENTSGWWNRIHAVDIDNDKDLDFVVGNLGRNSRICATEKNPAEMHVFDAENNGRIEQIISCVSEDGNNYPLITKTELQKQVPSIKRKFVYFKDFGRKPMDEIFDDLSKATIRKVQQPNTGVLINDHGKLRFEALPLETQFSPIHGIEHFDYNNDGLQDLILTGNFFDILPEIGRYDANYGLILLNIGKNRFKTIQPKQSGFFVKGQVRNMQKIKNNKGKDLFVLAKNSEKMQIFEFSK